MRHVLVSDLVGKTFELIENRDGYALGSTRMQFQSGVNPVRATYSGPNVVYGEAIVCGEDMLYHALNSEGQMSAGRANIVIQKSSGVLEMVLQWHWLTGEQTGGISKWRQVAA